MTTKEAVELSKFINKDSFVSIKDVQKSPTKTLFGFKIIMKNSQPQGVYMDFQDREDMLEDMEALSSDKYKKDIAESRKSKKFYTRDEIIKKHNLPI